MTRKAILITGSGGQLGQEIQFISASYPEFDFIFTDRNQLDITDNNAIKVFLQQNKIDYCINAAAYTHVDGAEQEAGKCHLINSEAVGYLSIALNKIGATLIHISTDYVYHNNLIRPLKEIDPTEPKGQYAKSKLNGELIALKNNKRTIILRTSWVFSSYGKNFVKTMRRLFNSTPNISVVDDQIGSPTYARDIAKTILHIIKQLELQTSINKFGIYNFCNQGICTWYQFARQIKSNLGADIDVHPITTAEFPTLAERPTYSALDTKKIQDKFKLHISHWSIGLSDTLEILSRKD